MRNQFPSVFISLGFALISPALSFAGSLTEAHVTKIVNEVKLLDPSTGDREAKLNDVVRDNIALTTGIKSRSELLFQDNTLTRLGPESYFSFKTGTRDMTLQKGTMLLQVPKGLGGAKIHTASVTATITGTTIMIEYVPQKAIKVLVLEGTLRLSMNGRFGDSLLLTPGKMVIMSPSAKRVPDPVTVDLKKVVLTSTLVNMQSKKGKQASVSTSPLPSMDKIESAIEQQQGGKDAHKLIDTNLVILGKGTKVELGSDELMDDLKARTDVGKTKLLNVVSAVPTPAPTPIPAPTPNINPPPSGTPPPPPPAAYLTDNTSTIATTNSSVTITTQGTPYSGVIYKDLATNGSPAGFLFGTSSAFDNQFDFDNFYLTQFGTSAVLVFDSLQLGGGFTFVAAGGPIDVALVGDNGITNSPGSNIDLTGIGKILFATKSGSITFDSGITFGSTGDKLNLVQFYARGGDLNIDSNFNLANSTLQFAAEDNAIFTGGTITAKNLVVTGLQTIQFDAHATASSLFQLNGGSVELGGAVTSNSAFILATSATVNGSLQSQNLTAEVSGDFILNNAGSLTTNGDMALTATNLSLAGTVSSNKLSLTATGAITLDGLITIKDALTATSATATTTGTLNLKQATFQTSGDFVLGSSGSITTTGADVAVTATSGGIAVDGIINSAKNVTLTASGAILIGHSITAKQISITGGSVAFTVDFNAPAGSVDLTATSGDVNATGHTLTGFDQILLNSGSVTVGSLTARTLSVGGTLAGGSITANTITTNALHADNVTANTSLTVNSADLAPYSTGTISINTPALTLAAGADLKGATGTPLLAPTDAFNLAITTNNFTLGASITLDGGDADPTVTDAGGSGGQLDLTSSGSVTINAPILATTGLNSTGGMFGGAGGTVNLTAQKTITLNNKIEVSSDDGNRKRSASGGHINIKSNATGGTAISVSSSAQLLALLNAAAPGPGGSIKFTSAGGAINMSGTAQADRGQIEITNNGSSGAINLTNATLAADTVKVGALGTSGTLNIGGGTISADTLLKLYAGGSSGTIDFTDNVTLSGASAKIIAADTVIINNGKIVTILGPSAADVFTNHPHYTGFGGDATTTGTFAGKGATTHPLSAAPGY